MEMIFPNENNAFKRVDGSHILDLYLGRDGLSRYTLMLVTEKEPPKAFSSQVILAETGKRKDQKWTFSFSLTDNHYYDLFCSFCSDIIESSRNLDDKKKGPLFVYGRYNSWQKMLKQPSSQILDVKGIKGLIGEMLFLKDYMIPKYGSEVAVASWLGPEGSDQDFVIDETWYEVKAKSSGATSVEISSIEQLDSDLDGKLAILFMDKTSITDENRVTLNILYRQILKMIDARSAFRFNRLLSLRGYAENEEYGKYAFNFKLMNLYSVNDDFPRLRRANISSGIENAKYEISISYISRFLEE